MSHPFDTLPLNEIKPNGILICKGANEVDVQNLRDVIDSSVSILIIHENIHITYVSEEVMNSAGWYKQKSDNGKKS